MKVGRLVRQLWRDDTSIMVEYLVKTMTGDIGHGGLGTKIIVDRV